MTYIKRLEENRFLFNREKQAVLYNKLFITKLGSSESVINILRIYIRPIQSYFQYLIEMDVHIYCETIIPLRIDHFTGFILYRYIHIYIIQIYFSECLFILCE